MFPWLNDWYAKKIDIVFLKHIQDRQADKSTKDWAHHYNLVVKDFLQRKHNYSEDKLDSTKDSLIKRGYLVQDRVNIFITEEGKKFLQGYYRFKALNIFKKISVIFGIGVFATISSDIVHIIWKIIQKHID